jgi:cysteinyl-tRNA synthetase
VTRTLQQGPVAVHTRATKYAGRVSLHLYDTATRTVRLFEPVREGEVSLYACGPTTQGAPHIGHLRTFLAVDVLVRWLRRSGLAVTYVRNVTDIDDKILAKSAEADVPWWAWSYRFENEFHRTLDDLGCVVPDYEPRATGHVPEMITFMQRLIERGHAYADGEGNVYFDVHSLPDYGSLTHQSLDEMQDAGEAPAPGKRDPRDFALWKAAKQTEPDTAAWDTPFGRGRPGWHLECSTMIRKYLGESFDIHAGGLDLRFPHHENEQAQSHGAGYDFARTWMHAGVLTVDGMKMGKSLDNFVTSKDALSAHPAPVVRLALLGAQYRATIEYNASIMQEAEVVWQRLSASVRRAQEALSTHADAAIGTTAADLDGAELPTEFVTAMDDDLNVPEAMAAVHRTQAALNTLLGPREIDTAAVGSTLASLRAMLDVLGLDPVAWGQRSTASDTGEHDALDALVGDLLAERSRARAAKDWARADGIRDQLTAAGIRVEDGAGSARWSIDTSTNDGKDA